MIIEMKELIKMLNFYDTENVKVRIENFNDMIIVEIFANEEARKKYRSEKIKAGIKNSSKKPGREIGKLDKLTKELTNDIKFYIENKRDITLVSMMRKHNISQNTLKKYIKIIESEV